MVLDLFLFYTLSLLYIETVSDEIFCAFVTWNMLNFYILQLLSTPQNTIFYHFCCCCYFNPKTHNVFKKKWYFCTHLKNNSIIYDLKPITLLSDSPELFYGLWTMGPVGYFPMDQNFYIKPSISPYTFRTEIWECSWSFFHTFIVISGDNFWRNLLCCRELEHVQFWNFALPVNQQMAIFNHFFVVVIFTL